MTKQEKVELSKAVERVRAYVEHPQFLNFVLYYENQFRKNSGFGRWLYEYTVADSKGLFKPVAIRKSYISILLKRSNLNFHYKYAVNYIGTLAEEATRSYIESHEKALYSIIVFTGEIASDEDDDPYVDLTYDEATQICEALNEEAEEELFKIKIQCQ